MQVEQTTWRDASDWSIEKLPKQLGQKAQLVIVFFAPRFEQAGGEIFAKLKTFYPNAEIVGCCGDTTICETRVLEDTLLATAMAFDSSYTKTAKIRVENISDSKEAGRRLSKMLPTEDLRHVMVFVEGVKLNPTKLVEGMVEVLPPGVGLTGGLASDGLRAQNTPIYYNEEFDNYAALAIGFYGHALRFSFSCAAGWRPYGPERIVTKSKESQLYELDGQPALGLYRALLGPFADRLPAIGLQFPLIVRDSASGQQGVRTPLAINEEDQSIQFAGEVPQGCTAQFLMTNANQLIKGAISAASSTKTSFPTIDLNPDVAFLLSCFARKRVLEQRTEEEIEAVRSILGNKPIFAGFYAFGEISPEGVNDKCCLQNQTMAITTISEQS